MLKVGRRFGIMHVMKGGWSGQTFAQAKRNESGGRKSRIRLPKEERKQMVEAFIKKYQSLNSGNFPSLNLTHKEVGGSFYTIREIVREIIQENRVLGPAKSLPEEHVAEKLFKQYPLGTISTEPEAYPSMLQDGNPLESHQDEDTTEELYIISDKVYARPGKEQIVNGSHINFINKESHGVDVANDQVSEPLERKKSMKEVPVSRAKVTEMADATLETFPLKPVTRPTDNLDGNSGEVRDLKESLVEKDVEKVPLGPLYDNSLSDGTSLYHNASLVDDKEAEKMTDFLLEGDSKLIDGKAVKTIEDLASGSSNSFSTESDIGHHTQVDIDVEVKSVKAIAETKEDNFGLAPTSEVVNTSNVSETKSLDGTYAIANSPEPASQEEAIIGNKADIQHGGCSEKMSNPTLDRINLESWEGEAKTPKQSETNPVVATFKSIIAAFVKFWSD